MEFLNIVAKDISARVAAKPHCQMKDLTVVFPNKRASLFFNQHLAANTQLPVWAPHYTTISELFQSMSKLTVADPALLVYYLYKAYRAETGDDETFDHFYSWGEVLLSDFDDIDSAMVDAEKLFVNITDLEQLTRFDYIDAEQEAAIRKLFSSFNIQSVTQLQAHYLHMWKAMPGIYKRFRQTIRDKGYAYPGMMRREVIECIKRGTSKIDETTSAVCYAIVGFNVLNETERQLFLHIKQTSTAWFYWDYDEAFANNPKYEAGMFVKENIGIFGNALDAYPDAFRNLSKPKDIKFVAASTDNAQSSYAGQWLRQTLSDRQPQNKTAIVLCDENLLNAVIHSIPPTFDDHNKTELNITMGYPLVATPVVGFVMSVLELKYRGWRPPTKRSGARWRYMYAERVLQHPFTLMMSGDDAISIITQCKRQNQTYPEQTMFETNPFISSIFQPPHDDVVGDLKQLNNILQDIGQAMVKASTASPIQSESIYTASTIVTRFINLIEEEGMQFDTPDTLLRLMRQTLSARSIAFHGEPAVGVQVMGILETRNLDFENIIMLSTNEGMLPRISHQPSFILNFLREAHGMTTMRRRVALYAYYFFRLISRAQHITLVYNNSTEGLHRGEMSRFMMQLQYEGIAATNGITHHTIVAETKDTNQHPQPSAINQFHPKGSLQGAGVKVQLSHLSPSALNTYLDCKRWFYLQYICQFREDDEVNEDVADNLFGSIFHNAMERYYAHKKGRELTAADYHLQAGSDHATTATRHTISRLVDQAFAKEMFHYSDADIDADRYTLNLSGTQLLNHEVICQYVLKQLTNDSNLTPLTILGTEQTIYTDVTFDVGGRQHTIQIGGIIDREDRVSIGEEQVHRIVDYKTSVHPKKADTIASLFNRTQEKRSSHILQAFYYCEVMMLSHPTLDEPLSPTLLYIKTNQDPTDAAIRIGNLPITNYQKQCHQEFASRLADLLAEIYNPCNEFEANTDDTHCTYCPFRQLCATPPEPSQS